MLKIIADDKIPYLKGALEKKAEVVYLPGGKINKNDLEDADALIIRTRTKCNRELLEGTSVKFIATATIGFDHIDTAYCEEAGINWTNAPGCNSGSVKQYISAVLLFLAVSRNFSLSEKTIGIVGVGNVGSKIAHIAQILGMNVLLNDPPRARKEGPEQFVELDQIVDEADIISFHVPLVNTGDDQTRHLVDKALLKKLSLDTILINSSRGEVVDNKALLEALSNERIAGAVLDVWENEPEINRDLLELVDIGTPHIAGYSRDGKANGTAMSVQAVSRFFSLGVDHWYPANVEAPKENHLEIDAENFTDEQVLMAAIGATYDVTRDDADLRKEPALFEVLRGNYPVRREFEYYHLNILNDQYQVQGKLQKLGFQSACKGPAPSG